MKMVHRNNKNNKGIKKLSDYIISFAFLYSAFLCFNEAANKWDEHKVLSTIILFCGALSFIAVFRSKIADFYYYIRKRRKNGK